MEFKKICMNCGHEFEKKILFDNTLICPKCLSGDIHQSEEVNYNDISTEECFILYHENKINCICDADKKEVVFMGE